MRNWDLSECRVRVNWPSQIQQVQVPIWSVITPICGRPNPIRQVVHLMIHIRSYPPHCFHLHSTCVSFSSLTLLSSLNTMLSHPSLSSHDMIISWHWVQHTPSTVSIHDWLSFLHSREYVFTPECWFNFRRTSPWELEGKNTLSYSQGCELTNRSKQYQHPSHRPSTASEFPFKHARLQPASESPKSLDYGL